VRSSLKRLIILLAFVITGLGAVALVVIFAQGAKQRTDTLELRLCVQRGLAAWDEEIIEAAKASFGQEPPPETNHRIVWREWAGPGSPPSEIVRIRRAERVFLALANDEDKCLTHDERFPQWQVVHCRIQRNSTGRLALGFTLSATGAEVMHTLSTRYHANRGHMPAYLLAMVVDGKVYATVRMVGSLRGAIQLSGQGLNRRDLERIQKALLGE